MRRKVRVRLRSPPPALLLHQLRWHGQKQREAIPTKVQSWAKRLLLLSLPADAAAVPVEALSVLAAVSADSFSTLPIGCRTAEATMLRARRMKEREERRMGRLAVTLSVPFQQQWTIQKPLVIICRLSSPSHIALTLRTRPQTLFAAAVTVAMGEAVAEAEADGKLPFPPYLLRVSLHTMAPPLQPTVTAAPALRPARLRPQRLSVTPQEEATASPQTILPQLWAPTPPTAAPPSLAVPSSRPPRLCTTQPSESAAFSCYAQRLGGTLCGAKLWQMLMDLRHSNCSLSDWRLRRPLLGLVI